MEISWDINVCGCFGNWYDDHHDKQTVRAELHPTIASPPSRSVHSGTHFFFGLILKTQA